MSGTIGNPTMPLQTVLPAYLYEQYSADDNISAFFTSYTELAQGYLEWFNQTPLAVYTSNGISGSLLDWTATGIYGISRPVLSSLQTMFVAGVNAYAVNTVAVNGNVFYQSGSATLADDDIYKRVLTWWLYRGDGKQLSSEWIRRRVARALFGANGADVSYDDFAQVSVVSQNINAPAAPVLSSVSGGTLAGTTYYARVTYVTPVGETNAGAEASFAVAANNLLNVTSPPQVNAAYGWNVYVSTATGTETKQNATPIALGAAWTEPTSGLISGAALPASNTSVPDHNFVITIPPSTAASYFSQAVSSGVLNFPFTDTISVVIT
ncbi:MAG: hypothetical protein B7X10_00255 [Burkholderiales bacterium 21-58-4]|nr:MAG: hypothetical protein B7X10_00255 [Burkholderiales bacterium 21-58-4]